MSKLQRYIYFRNIYRSIKKYNTIVIARHRGPDPDALGSQLALKELILNKYPKKRVYAVGGYATRFKFMGSLDKVDNVDYDNTLLIVLDTPDKKRVDIDELDNYKNIIKIDHHPVIDTYADIEFIDEDASSTCQLILEFCFKNRLKINNNIASNLFLGIVSDTGRFMHDYTSKETFNLVTRLINSTNLNFTSLYEPLYMRPLSEVRFQGYIYENMEVTDNGVAYIEITDEVLKEYGVDSASAGNIISELKCINEIIVCVFLTEDKKNNMIRANIRSRGPVINEIASKFGGGGHKFAAGVRLSDWEKASELVEELDKLMDQYEEQ
ncbi:MAG: bifunctional oligoribonuclease/PAP phosphatase NrnA [Bacilli bacterium]|nr:bifunctional oligoribonuclease/PAP phosphatase NrnA [Bacilli bacterium]